ncbi:MAG: THxN family PEP-CTERM protein [Pseudomonadota bacterium]|jgi:hypothetical protein
MKTFRNTLATIIAGSVALGALEAQAAYSPTTLTFAQSSGFETSSLTSTDNQGADDSIRWYEHLSGVTPPVGTFDTIAWGLPSKNNGGLMLTDPFTISGDVNTVYSGLRVTGLTGSVTTGADIGLWGAYQPITILYHKNSTISGSAFTLTGATIGSNLSIGAYTDPYHQVPVTFTETMNVGNVPGDCPAGAPNNTICDDLFKFQLTSFDPITFSIGGKTFEADFGIGLFNNSSTNFPVCDSSGVCTVWTAEGVTSDLSVLMRIREIPEPASMALVGLSLVGLAGLRRRRNA